MNFADRIFALIESEKNQSAFLKKVNWATSEISHLRENPEKSIGYNKLKSILDAYPSVSAEWLMRGEGSMERGAGDGSNINVQLANGHGNNQQYTVSDVAHLQALLAEKERLILVLMEKK